MCDDPDLTPADLRGEMFAMIERYGWMIQYVEAEPGHDAFAYTVGLTGLGLPEVYVRGLGATQSGVLLNAAARSVVDGDLGQCDLFTAPDGARYLAGLVVDAGDLLGALEAYGDDVSALELSRF
jgi:hypothetical protein